ncbi:DUF3889 domain-containing protein [Anaerobacillus sp. MEB173]|uniref:DUF3889 domain-containing protein n=1 Tax=Anaerobacillus sp. MEB173 TaxID=3383345 RepID=UPI003F8DBCA1
MKLNVPKLLLCFALLFIVAANVGGAQQPEYAKWGNTAVTEVKKQHPDWKVTDYLYEGKVIISDERQQYNFKLTIENVGEVRVYVLTNPKTDKLINVHVDETP